MFAVLKKHAHGHCELCETKFNFVSTVIPRSRISFDRCSKLPPIEYIGLPAVGPTAMSTITITYSVHTTFIKGYSHLPFIIPSFEFVAHTSKKFYTHRSIKENRISIGPKTLGYSARYMPHIR